MPWSIFFKKKFKQHKFTKLFLKLKVTLVNSPSFYLISSKIRMFVINSVRHRFFELSTAFL